MYLSDCYINHSFQLGRVKFVFEGVRASVNPYDQLDYKLTYHARLVVQRCVAVALTRLTGLNGGEMQYIRRACGLTPEEFASHLRMHGLAASSDAAERAVFNAEDSYSDLIPAAVARATRQLVCATMVPPYELPKIVGAETQVPTFVYLLRPESYRHVMKGDDLHVR